MSLTNDLSQIRCYRSAIKSAPGLATLQAICEDMIGNPSLCETDDPRASLLEYLAIWEDEVINLD